MRISRPFLIAAVIALNGAAASLASAQTSQTTAAATPSSAAAVATTDPTSEQIARWLSDSAPAGVDAATPAETDAAPVRDRAVHGEAGVTFGTGGYRAAYGVATMPIGESSALTVGVADSHANPKYWGGGDHQSLGVALQIGGARSSAACGCGQGGYCAVPRWGVGLADDARAFQSCPAAR